MSSYPYYGEDFCIVHGHEHMRSTMGNPIPWCEACELRRCGRTGPMKDVKISAGAKILDGLRDALSGNFAAVTIEGQRWIKAPIWQPIETAPKDRFILLYCPEDNSRWFAKWQGGEWYGSDGDHGILRTGHSLGDPDYVTGWFVSHWMEVPAGPHSPADRAP